MKLYLILALCAVALAAPSLEKGPEINPVTTGFQLLKEVFQIKADKQFRAKNFDGKGTPVRHADIDANDLVERNFLVNALVRQLIAALRRVINEGSTIFDLPPLDPLELEHYHLNIPAQIINLDLELKNILVTGFGGFVVHNSHLDLSQLTFDIKISVPRIDIGAEEYELIGDLYSAIPLFGKGKAMFHVDDFTFSAKLFLKQSENLSAIVIDKIENASFEIPSLKSNLSGVIGGGDIDAVVNAITEDVIVNYLNRFQAAIASVTSSTIIKFGNPLLEQLDTWQFIAPLIPRPRP